MATRGQDISRFFLSYQKFIILIGIALVIQIFLAIHVVLPGSWDISGDGSKARFRSPGSQESQKHEEEGQTHNSRLGASESPVQQTVTASVKKNSPEIVNSSLFTLDLQSLTFAPECNITSRDSISAIHRAKTQLCKDELANLSCKIANDVLYAKRLPRLCTNSVTTYGRYVGCFKDSPKDRLLSGHLSLFKDTNSPQICVDLCLQSGFQYAGLQYGVECFCGNALPSSHLKLVSERCDMECPGDDAVTPFNISSNTLQWNKKCGGYFAMDVFETGVFQDYELSNKVIGLDGRMEDGQLAPRVDRTVQIVFFLTLNGRAVRQVLRLIKALFHERHYFYIHVDSRQDYLYRKLQKLYLILPDNIRFMKQRKATIWGGASLLTVLLAGMEELVNNTEEWKWTWDYVINLSESDFPLKSTEKLEEFLSYNAGRNFVKSHGRDVQKFIQKQGLDKTFYECEYRMWRVADRKLPSGIMIDGGSDWIALHKDFIHYVIKSEDELVTHLKTVFKYTLLPAESFFHTVLRNSQHCRSFVDNNLHVTNWRRKLGCKCQYRNVVDWCGCSPNDFRMSDWNRLLLTVPRLLFFGRKFEAVVNQEIINKLESWLYPDRFESHYPTMNQYWLSLYHYHDLSPKPEDLLVTFGRSLSRIAAKEFASRHNCSVYDEESKIPGADKLPELLEVLVYNQDDTFRGLLVRFSTPLSKRVNAESVPEVYTVGLEAWFQLEPQVVLAPWSQKIGSYRSKIQSISVGTDHDQKEQMFRNFAHCIGPFSEPVVTYSMLSDEPLNITAVFIDPSETVQAVQNSSVVEGSSSNVIQAVQIVNFVKPALKTPLKPGKWSIKLLTADGHLLAEVKMLVLPLEIYQAKEISIATSKLMTSQEPVNGDSYDADPGFMKALQDRIDNLVSEFYHIQDFCVENEQNHVLLSKWRAERVNEGSQGQSHNVHRSSTKLDTLATSLCSHTQWSSLFPDPKSSIIGIDPETGLLLP